MVKEHHVRVYKSEENLGREDQLACKIAEVAADPVEVDRRGHRHGHQPGHRQRRGGGRLARTAPRSSRPAPRRSTHGPSTGGKGANGLRHRASASSPEWAAWANGVAVRELDYHDTFLAADYSHPGDNIPPILAVAQHVGSSGRDLVRGIATGYEIQVDLVKAICLHKHKIDHVAHLGPSAAAGIGTLLGLDVETIFQAVGQALHTTTATRQSRKGEISTWKAHAPAFAGKMAVEAVGPRDARRDLPRADLRGRRRRDRLDAGRPGRLLRRAAARRPARPSAAILDTYTKEHSAEYQAQAWIDLARKLHGEHPEAHGPGQRRVDLIHTSHHTHYVIGSGANDPQKYDPDGQPRDAGPLDPVHLHRRPAGRHLAPRRLLRPRARRPRRTPSSCGTRSRTVEDPEWTRRYHSAGLDREGLRRPRGDHARRTAR